MTLLRSGTDILGERARLTPHAPALVVIGSDPEPQARFDYAELDARAVRCARLFTETLGLAKGDRVCILAHNRVEYLDAFFAAGKTGIILVTLGTRLTAAELEHVVRDSGAKALLFDGELAETTSSLRSLLGEDGPVASWVALDRTGEATLRYAQAIDALGQAPDWQPTPCDAEDVYCLLYTSGTTGKPKGVMIPHRQVLANGIQTVLGWQLRSDDVSPIFTPLYHAGGLMAFLVPIFTIGGTIVLHRSFDAGRVWRTIENEGATVVLGVPTIWKMLLETPEFETTDTSSLRWLISGGAPLPRYLALAYQHKGIAFKQGFGMTEVGVNCFAMTVEDSERKLGSIGKPLMQTEVRLVDEDGRDVAAGEVGELLFRGAHVCKGYWNNPEATARALDSEGWFHSGDKARQDEDGYFYVAGRAKDMIISGGVNIYPAEIEAALLQHPAIEDAAVVGVPDERWGEVGVAFVLPRAVSPKDSRAESADEPDELEAEDIMGFLGDRIARYKIPKIYRFLAELPRTAYGKVVKGDLREQYLAEVSIGRTPDSEEPTSEEPTSEVTAEIPA